MSTAAADARPLVLHVVFRFDTGGLENGVVKLIDQLPADRYRHAVLALTEVTSFRERVQRKDVEFIALHKKPGHGFWLYPELYRVFKRLRPMIVHTRNLAALEAVVPAWAAGVPIRVHGEHGRDLGDLDGSNRGQQRLRRLYSPFVHRYIALSRDLADYLSARVGIRGERIAQVYNGVEIERFARPAGRAAIPACPFGAAGEFIVGSVGRMQGVKDPLNLARAFVLALQQRPELRARLRLVMVGGGPLLEPARALLQDAGVAELSYLPGERSDVAEVMRGLDCFVLPSLAEGISNTILEAMASSLPVIATAVGGNAELVLDGQTGSLVPSGNAQALADAMLRLADDAELAARQGRAGRTRVEQQFSMKAMLQGYQQVYDSELQRRARPKALQLT
ncbi:TIGR03088 family PEP-CTERM/XrtA system glycosyltransferase [Paucibacter sediminis]|uniref:TIGR03088 family PEP-CTERM/XrtA system glycosyltransferase n=1 Tax=Paucibacter sediminis TaxID=3019553 RepID=A0AA95SKQ7_9BURK|nr:TIGR03088 family PEP-CTERM/XrtA system glycosyltransferase [Paucibacter sp. S2-9]WIT11348.1 TIGR03088 family PEP-CTERM/XrtA system glycosyltransferase [Paucibacter sp. S2-9]